MAPRCFVWAILPGCSPGQPQETARDHHPVVQMNIYSFLFCPSEDFFKPAPVNFKRDPVDIISILIQSVIFFSKHFGQPAFLLTDDGKL